MVGDCCSRSPRTVCGGRSRMRCGIGLRRHVIPPGRTAALQQCCTYGGDPLLPITAYRMRRAKSEKLRNRTRMRRGRECAGGRCRRNSLLTPPKKRDAHAFLSAGTAVIWIQPPSITGSRAAARPRPLHRAIWFHLSRLWPTTCRPPCRTRSGGIHPARTRRKVE